MDAKFDELVRGLEQPMLEELRRSVAAELDERRSQTAIRIEHIHARMSGDDKIRAMEEIARVLREEEGYA